MNYYIKKYVKARVALILISVWCSVCSTFVLSAEKQAASPPDKSDAVERIVAIVNEDIITQLELESEMQLIKQQIRSQRSNLPPDSVLQKQVLDRLIALNIQLQIR